MTRDSSGKARTFMPYDVDTAKQRIARVFRYLGEMHRVRTPPIVSLETFAGFHRAAAAVPRTAGVVVDDDVPSLFVVCKGIVFVDFVAFVELFGVEVARDREVKIHVMKCAGTPGP